MILSTSKRFLFIHGIKTAGTSLRSALLPYARPEERSFLFRVARRIAPLRYRYPFYDFFSHPHTTLGFAKSVLPVKVYGSLNRFGIVRQPEDWLLSVYKHWERKHAISPKRTVPKTVRDLESFLAYFRDTGIPLIQALQFADEAGRIDLTTVGSFEHLERFTHSLQTQLGIQIPLPALNRSPEDQKVSIGGSTRRLLENTIALDQEIFEFSGLAPEGIRRIRCDSQLEKKLAYCFQMSGGLRYDPWGFTKRSIGITPFSTK